MKTRIVVLGSTGMLGNVVANYFDRSDDYITFMSYMNPNLAFGRNKFYFDALNREHLAKLPDADYVINCIGCVKQKDYDIRTYMKINAQFPHFLANECERRGSKLIHITTDCVFSGKDGNYHELDEPDCIDPYGISKELGEPRNCMVIRTSVIGREIRSFYSLLEWALSQRGNTVTGYTNHFWNGITNLQYAKVCDKIIRNNLHMNALRHVFSTRLSKHDILIAFNEKYDLCLNIVSGEHELNIDRSLATIYKFNDELAIPSFKDMLSEIE